MADLTVAIVETPEVTIEAGGDCVKEEKLPTTPTSPTQRSVTFSITDDIIDHRQDSRCVSSCGSSAFGSSDEEDSESTTRDPQSLSFYSQSSVDVNSRRVSLGVSPGNIVAAIKRQMSSDHLEQKKRKKKVKKFYQNQSQLLENIIEDKKVTQRAMSQKALDTWKENPDVQAVLDVAEANGDANGKANANGEVMIVVERLMESSSVDCQCCDDQGSPKPFVSPTSSVDEPVESETLQLDEGEAEKMRKDRRLALLMFLLNFALLLVKAIACGLSSSLTIISSCVDSAIDILSSFVIWMSTRAVKRHDSYKFPRGRSRLEPLTIVVMAIIRGAACFLIIEQSIMEMFGPFDVEAEAAPIAIMAVTVVLKLVAAVYCYIQKTPNASLFYQDNRNDCISNAFAIVCAYIGDSVWNFADPIGAILVSIYIIVTWYFTGRDHTKVLSGRSASPEYLSRILTVVVEHDSRITQVTRLYAYHFGFQFLVEVDLAMDPNATVGDAVEIIAGLQAKINRLPYVERSFIMLDRHSQPYVIVDDESTFLPYPDCNGNTTVAAVTLDISNA